MQKSNTITEISKAIALFNLKVAPTITKESINPYFNSKYAGLPNILTAIKDALTESDLILTQFPEGDGLTTTLIHTPSGEYFEATMKMTPAKSDPQAQGSAITYARRYAIVSILCLNVDNDDDANLATMPPLAKPPRKAWLNKNTPEFEKAVAWLKTKQPNATIAEIKKKYNVNADDEKLLIKLSNE